MTSDKFLPVRRFVVAAMAVMMTAASVRGQDPAAGVVRMAVAGGVRTADWIYVPEGGRVFAAVVEDPERDNPWSPVRAGGGLRGAVVEHDPESGAELRRLQSGPAMGAPRRNPRIDRGVFLGRKTKSS